MKFLLNLKAWQLFVILFIGMISSSDSSYGLFISMFFFLIYVSWIYQIGITMYNLIAVQSRPGIRYFKFCCLFMLFLSVLSELFYVYIIQFIPQRDIIEPIISIIVPCYAGWTWLYISMFSARMLESAIEGRLVMRSDSMKGFVCIIAFPIGVWYIQPAVQRVLNKYKVVRAPLVEQ
jgi:hypothetical protein